MDGIIVINKEKGYTSNDVVQIVKKTFNSKVGHCGTLDPMATGVLPILVGKGTLCSKYLINHDKIYVAIIKLGQKTDTADMEGNIIEEKNVEKKMLEDAYVEKVLESFKGKQKQMPPIYSAIKVQGKKLYEYARNNQKVEITPRDIEIYDIGLININREENEITYRVSCSKGTYIRSLCEDIAERIGTVGYMKELERHKVGAFEIEESIRINELKERANDINFIDNHFLSIEDLFKEKEEIKLNTKEIPLLLNGVKIFKERENGIYRIYDKDDKFIGIGVVENNKLKRDVIL